MKDQKNQLATLSPKQSNPYTAQASDFEITRDSSSVYHGQRNPALLKESQKFHCEKNGRQDRPTETSDAEAPHTDGF